MRLPLLIGRQGVLGRSLNAKNAGRDEFDGKIILFEPLEVRDHRICGALEVRPVMALRADNGVVRVAAVVFAIAQFVDFAVLDVARFASHIGLLSVASTYRSALDASTFISYFLRMNDKPEKPYYYERMYPLEKKVWDFADAIIKLTPMARDVQRSLKNRQDQRDRRKRDKESE